ncbi:cellulose-binding domain-containing protein [Dactylosporangium sp. NPDC049525]|uniref:cellulose-binding domain-containing protein n=1 Tax=Dactylosporangium sp. NPDC049525 TaxID=3154730 RepID=UPI003425A6E2
MFRRSVVLPAAAVMLASAGIVYLAQTSNAQVNAGLDLSAGNRRPAVAGLYDWSRAGYRGGADLPGAGQLNPDPNCQITPAELDTQYGVRAGDNADDTGGVQAAIDAIKAACSPSASYTKLSLLSLPAGTLNVSREIHVDADYLVLRGTGSGTGGTQFVYRPDANTVYDALTEDGSDWDEDGMTSGQGKGGWLWPGRGLFRVQSRGVHSAYAADYAAAPANRKDIFEGTVNVHWKVGVALRAKPGDAGFAARTGDTTVYLASSGSLSNLVVGGLVNVRAANTVKFYAQQNIAPGDGTLLDQHMRQQIFTVTAVDTANRTVTLNKPLEFDVPVDSTSDGSPPIGSAAYASKVSPIVDPVVGVGFENLAFTQDIPGLDRAAAVHNYGNMAPAQEMHGIVFKWAADSWVSGVRAEMTGSHPIVTEEAYHLQIVGNSLDGAWNKGKGGNGYFRGSRVWDSLYAGNTSRNLRHFTFQWSASGNVVIGNDFDSDLNLHGGWERNNLFENNTVTVPFEHRSANCTTNCGEEGGGGVDASTWFPIWWAAGKKAVKWSGSSGPRNVFFHNTMRKQVTAGAALTPFYADAQRVYQFGWNGSGWQHLDAGGVPIADWAGNEQRDYTGGHGVDASRTDAAASLFLRSLTTTPTSPSASPSVSPSKSPSTSPSTSPSASASASSSPPAGGCLTVTFARTSTWSNGYGAEYTLTNRCTTATTGWKVEFDLPSGTTVSNSWSSVRTSSGQHHTFTNATYNGAIKPGKSTTFGFNAAGTGLPTNCRVNGSTC